MRNKLNCVKKLFSFNVYKNIFFNDLVELMNIDNDCFNSGDIEQLFIIPLSVGL